MALRRIAKELKEIESNCPQNISAGPIGDDLLHWNATILGPSDTPYHDFVYHLDVRLPKNYPMKPPKIKFNNKIWHCNINPKKSLIALHVLQENWSSSLTMSKTLWCICY